MNDQTQKENIHVDIPFNYDMSKPDKPITEIFTERYKKDLDKMLMEFGKQNGFPVFFVISTKFLDPPQKDPIHDAFITSQTDVKCFKNNEKLAAVNYAQKVMGTLGIFHPQVTQVRSNEMESNKKLKMYMLAGGSVGRYDDWWITDKDGKRINLVDEGRVNECYYDSTTHTYQPVFK